MTSKILGALLIIAAICGVIFLYNYIPVYTGVSELEQNFNECIGNFKQYKQKGCRTLFAKTIDKNYLDLYVEDIEIDAAYLRESTISAEWEQEINFFGYKHIFIFEISKTGVVPDRD